MSQNVWKLIFFHFNDDLCFPSLLLKSKMIIKTFFAFIRNFKGVRPMESLQEFSDPVENLLEPRHCKRDF